MQTQDCYRSCHRNAPEETRCCVNSGSFCKVLCPIFVSFSLKLWLSRLPVFTHPYSCKCPQAFLKDMHLSLLTFRIISEALPKPCFSFPSQLVITPRFLYPQSSNILLQVEGLHCCFHPSFSISEKCPLHATKRRTKQLCLKQRRINFSHINSPAVSAHGTRSALQPCHLGSWAFPVFPTSPSSVLIIILQVYLLIHGKMPTVAPDIKSKWHVRPSFHNSFPRNPIRRILILRSYRSGFGPTVTPKYQGSREPGE